MESANKHLLYVIALSSVIASVTVSRCWIFGCRSSSFPAENSHRKMVRAGRRLWSAGVWTLSTVSFIFWPHYNPAFCCYHYSVAVMPWWCRGIIQSNCRIHELVSGPPTLESIGKSVLFFEVSFRPDGYSIWPLIESSIITWMKW